MNKNMYATERYELKAAAEDFWGRFREIISDPLNVLIDRDPRAGIIEDGLVWLHNGNRVPIMGAGAYYGRFSEILVVNRGVHEPLEEYVFQEVLRIAPEDPVMLELGAYWSHYSMWLKRYRPRARVSMIEPDLTNLESGKSNFAFHGFGGEFINAFVGRGHFEVDSWMAERGFPRLFILHVDIQGFEMEMLEGARESLSRGLIDYMFVSTHSQELHNHVVAKLTGSGMRTELSADFDFETTSFDGFVLASRLAIEPLFSGLKPLGRRDLLRSRPNDLVNYLVQASSTRLSV